MKRIMGIAAILALAACSSTAPSPTATATTPATFAVSGVVRVELDWVTMGQQGMTTVDGTCIPDADYKDVAEGVPVVVMDGSGATVGKSSLGPAVLSVAPGGTTLHDGWCELPFSVEAVAGLDFYRVRVGSRDPLDFSGRELADGEVILTVGHIPG